MQGKLRGIEIVSYFYGRWFFLLLVQIKFKPQWQEKTQTPQSQKRPQAVANLWSKDTLILRCVMFDFRSDIWVKLSRFLKKLTPLRLQGPCH